MFFNTVVVGIHDSTSNHDAIAAANLVPHARHLYAGEARHGCGVDVVGALGTSPADGLKRLAVAEAADLLILGSANHGPAGSITLGELAHGVLHGASCPVLVPPRGFADAATLPLHIGLAYDGSPEAERVLRFADGLAQAAGAWLEIVQAVDLSALPPIPGRDHREHVDAIIAGAQGRLDDLVAGLASPACGHVISGPVQQVLGTLGDRVDLLLCGSRSWGPATRISLGGVAERLMQHVPCPVLVVPRVTGLPLHEVAAPAGGDRDRLTTLSDA